jgi:hypothetical protein
VIMRIFFCDFSCVIIHYATITYIKIFPNPPIPPIFKIPRNHSRDITPAVKARAFVFPIIGLPSKSGITVPMSSMAALRGGHEYIPRFYIGGGYKRKMVG